MRQLPDVPKCCAPVQLNTAVGAEREKAERAEFIDRLREGDEHAFARLYEENRGLVRRYLASRVGPADDVDDLVQETFYQAYRSIHRFEARSSIPTWLIGIARYVSFRARRSASRWMCGSHPMSSPTIDVGGDARIAPRIDARRMLETCDSTLGGLRSGDAAEIFRLRYVDGHTTREVADRVGKSNDAVKMSLQRTRQALRRGCKGIDELQAAS